MTKRNLFNELMHGVAEMADERGGVSLTDRELLELAAKAAGVEIRAVIGDTLWMPDGICWNPLIDGADALRLSVKLGMNVDVHRMYPNCGWPHPWVEVRGYESRRVLAMVVATDNGASLDAATCRAIVCAAAEIGRSMP